MSVKNVYEKLTDWIVPVLLAAACKILWDMQGELRSIAITSAVGAQRTSDHERRLDNLEHLFLRTVQDP